LCYLHTEGIISIIMGGSQDITYGAFLALEKLNFQVNLTTIDSCLDVGWRDDGSAASTYLAKIFHDHSTSLFNYANIGHQVYFVDDAVLEYMEERNFNGMRLGEARADIRDTEPVLRDTHLLSIDMSAVRYADAPRTTHPSPNGLYGEEICQLARYAGLSEKLSMAGVFEIIPGDSNPGITSHLAAQVIWYMLDGIASRMDEWPLQNDEEFRKYIVEVGEADQVLVFYKSQRSGRWWMEVPAAGEKDKVRIVAASYNDYKQACNQELPERWFRLFRLLN
jgi:arginase family enzyme